MHVEKIYQHKANSTDNNTPPTQTTPPTMVSQQASQRSERAPVVPWQREEVEKLISWMEDNSEDLRGKQCKWHRHVKDGSMASSIST